MPRQRRPHVVLRIGHADLAQEARDRADERDVAPGEAGRQHQRVVAVVLGAAGHHHQEAGFQPLLGIEQVDLAGAGLLQHHVVQPDVGPVVGIEPDVVGLLVHHAEAHVLEHRHALRQRDRPAEAPHLEADAAIDGLGAPVEVRAQRTRRRQAGDHLDVVDGDKRRIAGAIAFRERVAVALEQLARAAGVVHHRERVGQAVGPGADDVADGLFQRRALRPRRFAGVAADDEVHAHQLAFREGRIVGAHAALVDLGEILADRGTHRAVVAVARHEHEHRDEAVELVVAREHPHARPLVELQDQHRELVERVLVDLEQLVAREGIEHVGQRLAGMAVGIEAGAPDDGVDLAAQIGDGAGRARVDRRREQADDAEFPDQLAGGIEALDADVVHVRAPVHLRAHRRLGDDQELRLHHEGAQLGRDLHKLRAGAQHAAVGRAQQPEPGLVHRHQRAVLVEDVVAGAEEGEVVVGQPFEERDRLLDLLLRQRRRIDLELGRDLADARRHRAPVGDAEPHVREHDLERGQQFRPLRSPRRCVRGGYG